MLVLSRRIGEKLLFPTIGVTLEVLNAKGNTVRLGIQAPEHVRILRGELAEEEDMAYISSMLTGKTRGDKAHLIRNQLHAATIAIHLLRKQLERGMVEEADRTFQKIVEQFQALEQEAVAECSARLADRRAPDPRPAEQQNQRSCRALLVEDDRNECELLAGLLRMSGFQVDTSGDGADALDYLSTHERPDVLLLDMFMPRCDGPKTVEAVRGNPQYAGMKVIAISGTSPELLGVATGPKGVDRWFPKPLDPETLVRELSHEMEGKCRCRTSA